MQIKDNTFLITGGASGLGSACVRRLAEAGGKIVIADLNAEAGRALAAELGPVACFSHVDVRDPTQVTATIVLAQREFGAVNGLVQCAGILDAARIVGREGPHDLGLFERVIRINLIGTFNVLRLTAAAMSTNSPSAEGERGVIINTSSVAATDGQ